MSHSQKGAPPSLLTSQHQRVTFVELFFDLVFVFSVTQTAHLLYAHPGWLAVGQAVLVFWLIWWAWTQYAWALNAANADHPLIAMAVLGATGAAFFMAVAVPEAFGEHALWFAATYVLVRLFGLLIYYLVASASAEMKGAVRGFMLRSLTGMVAVIAGALLGGVWQYGLWAAAILLDVVAALFSARNESWFLRADHFAERHGLFVIIALGESLIVAAGQVSAADWTGPLLAFAVLSVAVTGAMWWSYFPRTKPALDHVMATVTGSRQSTLARDAYSIFHFVIIGGIIAYAAAIQIGAVSPLAPLSPAGRLYLAAGLLLFLEGMGLALWRASRLRLWPRAVISALIALAILLLAGVPAIVSMGLALAGIALILLIEQRDPRLRSSEPEAAGHLGAG